MENKPKKKKSIFKRWWFWVIVIIVIAGIVGANSNSPKKVGEKAAPTTTTSSKPADTESKTKIFKVGDIIQLKEYKVTVNKIRADNGGDMMKPADGNEYFYVDCTIENISKEQQTVSSMMMFKVEDSDGRSYEQAIPEHQNGQLDGDVSAGQKITGEYVVEVPKKKTGLRLVFDSSVLTGGQIIVQLN